MSHSRIVEMLSESGLDPDQMGDVALALAPLAEVDEVPVPSAELAHLFGERGTDRAVPSLLGRRRTVAGVLVLALSGVSATGLSAAANTLPRPLQHGVSQFSQHYLPFDLPEPPPPPKEQPPLGAPTPSGPSPMGERADDSASRSIQGRAHDPAAAPDAEQQDRPSATAQPYASPSAAPSYSAVGFSGPSPSAQPSPSGSPTPSEDWNQGSGGRPTPTPTGRPTDKGDQGKGKDKGGNDKGKDRDKGGPSKDDGHPGPDQGHQPGGGDDRGPGHGSDPGEDDSDQPTTPLPELPLPELPVPDPSPTPFLPGTETQVSVD